MARGDDLESIKAAGFAADSGGSKISDDPVNIFFIHCSGEAPMQDLSSRRRGHDRYPFARIGGGAPAKMRDLSHQERIMLMVKV